MNDKFKVRNFKEILKDLEKIDFTENKTDVITGEDYDEWRCKKIKELMNEK